MKFFQIDESYVVKPLGKLPKEIRAAYSVWRNILIHEGFNGLRNIKGFHMEKLKCHRLGQYSCRLNKGYRVIFIQEGEKTVVLEVNNHGY
jgi:Txe/YoeB family toxin of Txe-Axe toxin-antitoxin module